MPLGEVFGAIAVLITLLYFAKQVRQLNKQGHLEAFQHMQDQLNTYLRHISESEETAELAVKGRQSYSSHQARPIYFVNVLTFKILKQCSHQIFVSN